MMGARRKGGKIFISVDNSKILRFQRRCLYFDGGSVLAVYRFYAGLSARIIDPFLPIFKGVLTCLRNLFSPSLSKWTKVSHKKEVDHLKKKY